MTPDEIIQANLGLASKWRLSQGDVAAIMTAHHLSRLADLHEKRVLSDTSDTNDWCTRCQCHHAGVCRDA